MVQSAEIRVPYHELIDVLARILMKVGFTGDRARRAAGLFADASRDGVYSHGVNRFLRFLRALRSGIVDPQATPVLMWLADPRFRCAVRVGIAENDSRRGNTLRRDSHRQTGRQRDGRDPR